jgi:hypothetical protein
MDVIKPPVFWVFASVDHLKRCLHGEIYNPNGSLKSLFFCLRIHKTASLRNDTFNFGLCDAVLCFNDCVEEKNYVLNILGECGLKIMNAMVWIHRKRARKTEIVTGNITRETGKIKRTVKIRSRRPR